LKADHIITPVLLDVTLRDGGYLNGWAFSRAQMHLAAGYAIAGGADLVEIGYVDDRAGLPAAASLDISVLDDFQRYREKAGLVVMCRPSVEDPLKVLHNRRSLIDLVRIPVDLRMPELAARLAEICASLDISFSYNLTNISCYSDAKIAAAFELLPDKAVVTYIADSRGSLRPEHIPNIYQVLRSVRDTVFGFHAHNNLGLACENTLAALGSGAQWIDGSLMGIGLGGRNLDLADAVDLALPFRSDICAVPLPDIVHTFDFGVPPPGDEMEMYKLTGEKNFKMEWAVMMEETIGREATCTIIRSLTDVVMFRPEELKPFVHEEIWNTLRW
jgi:4-hydroxy 2-oxovalerate aldolase